MAERRGRGEDAVYFDHAGAPCKDARYHRQCSGRWRGAISLGTDAAGRRIWKKVSGKTKTEVYARLAELRQELAQGIKSSATYTVRDVASDWLES